MESAPEMVLGAVISTIWMIAGALTQKQQHLMHSFVSQIRALMSITGQTGFVLSRQETEWVWAREMQNDTKPLLKYFDFAGDGSQQGSSVGGWTEKEAEVTDEVCFGKQRFQLEKNLE